MTQAEREQRSAKRRPKSRIPTFKTVEEEAAFWDTHSFTEFEDELEEATDVKFVAYQPKNAITVKLGQDTLIALTEQAKAKGVDPSTLARMWILEHLHR